MYSNKFILVYKKQQLSKETVSLKIDRVHYPLLFMMASSPEPCRIFPSSFADDVYDEEKDCLICTERCLPKDPKNPSRWKKWSVLQCPTGLLKRANERDNAFDRFLRFRLCFMWSSITRLVHEDCRIRFLSGKLRPGSLPRYTSRRHKYEFHLETASGLCFGMCASQYCRVVPAPVQYDPFDSEDDVPPVAPLHGFPSPEKHLKNMLRETPHYPISAPTLVPRGTKRSRQHIDSDSLPGSLPESPSSKRVRRSSD